MRTALPLAVLILGASVALAQQPGVPTTMNSFLPIGDANGTTYGRATVLDADGDSLADIFFLHGTEIEGVFAPGVFMSFYDWISTDDYDVACLPDGASSGADALLSVGSSGLLSGLLSRELVWNGNNASWSVTELESWEGAKRLDCRVLGSETWIFGLLPDLQSNLRTVRARAYIGSGWTEGALFTTTFDVTEIGAMDYQGDGTLEVAVIGGSRWEIWSRNGSAFAPWTRAASGVQSGFTLLDLAVGAQSGNSAEWVAFLASNNETPDRSCLILRDSAGTQTPEEISGQPDAIAVEAGDLNGDGNDDLVLSIRADAAMLVAVNQSTGSSPAFDGARTATPPAQPPTLTFEIPIVTDDFEQNGAHPIVADFDNDFDLDFCLPLEPPGYTEAMLYVHRDPLPGIDWPPAALEIVFNSCGEPDRGITVEDDDLGDCSSNLLLLPLKANLSGSPYDAVESFLWMKEPIDTYTTPESICWEQVLNPGPSPSYPDLDLTLASNPGFIGETTRDGTIYYFVICYADLNASGQVIGIFRPQVYGFQTQCNYGSTCTNQGLLDDYASGTETEVNSSDCNGTVSCADGPGIWTGTSVPVPCIPQLPPNNPPQLLRNPCGS